MSLFLVPLNPRRGMIYGLLALAETAWLAPLLIGRILSEAIDPIDWFLTLLVCISLVILLGWLTEIYGIPLEFARVLGLGLAIVSILALAKMALYPTTGLWQLGWIGRFLGDLLTNPLNVMGRLIWILLAVGYIWWRCLEIGQTPPELSVTRSTLQIGFLGMVLALILGALNPVMAPPFGLVLLFGTCCLLANSLAYTETIAQRHGEAAVGGSSLRLLNGLAALGLIAVVALVISAVFSFSLLESIFQILFVVLQFILGAISAVLIQILIWLGPLFDALANWLQSLTLDVPPPEATPAAAPTPLPPEAIVETDPVWWSQYLLWAWRAFIILLVLWLLYRLMARLGRRFRPEVTSDGAQTQGTVPAEMPSLGDLWAAGRDKLAEWVGLVRQFGLGQDLRAAVTIRRIYAALVALAERHELKRAPAQTPLEFLKPLAGTWPELAGQFRLITEAYVQVHYGQVPEDGTAVEQVQRAWNEVYETISLSAKNG